MSTPKQQKAADISAAIYHWDKYLLSSFGGNPPSVVDLALATRHMRAYRAAGGDMYEQTELAINAAVASHGFASLPCDSLGKLIAAAEKARAWANHTLTTGDVDLNALERIDADLIASLVEVARVIDDGVTRERFIETFGERGVGEPSKQLPAIEDLRGILLRAE